MPQNDKTRNKTVELRDERLVLLGAILIPLIFSD